MVAPTRRDLPGGMRGQPRATAHNAAAAGTPGLVLHRLVFKREEQQWATTKVIGRARLKTRGSTQTRFNRATRRTRRTRSGLRRCPARRVGPMLAGVGTWVRSREQHRSAPPLCRGPAAKSQPTIARFHCTSGTSRL